MDQFDGNIKYLGVEFQKQATCTSVTKILTGTGSFELETKFQDTMFSFLF